MNPFLNPYLILAGVLLWIGSCAGAAWLGYDYRDGKVAQQVARAQAETLKQAQADAAADLQASITRVRAEATAQARVRAAKTAGVQDATLKARPDCGRDDQSLGLLNAAIDAANAAPASTGSMPPSVRSAAETR